MGTTVYCGPRDRAIESELRTWERTVNGVRVGGRCIKKKWSGWTKCWYLYENWRIAGDECEVSRHIGVLLVQSYPASGEWGIKSVDECMGPCEVDAPLSWLAETTEPTSPYAKQWRERVRVFHQLHGTGVKLRVGQRVVVRNGLVGMMLQVKPPMRADIDGVIYRLSRRDIKFPETLALEARS